jgi:cytochrome c biogenesis protein CcmG/thiol:disulfide interchange protein DsbE
LSYCLNNKKNDMNRLLVALAFVLSGVSVFSQAKIGLKEVPSIQVEDLAGKKINLKEYVKPGKNYVLTFWATWCVPCKRELTNMVDLQPKWRDNFNTEIIAVSTDDSRAKSKIKSYVAGENWPFTVMLDQNQDLMRALGIQSIPFTMIIDKNGQIVYSHNSYVEGDEFEIENKLASISQ